MIQAVCYKLNEEDASIKPPLIFFLVPDTIKFHQLDLPR